jgi:predicted ester cyclase
MKKFLMILPLVLILCLMVRCQDKAAMAELGEFRTQAALEEQNIELIRNTNETWMKRDYERIRELCAPDFAYHSSNSEPLSVDEVIEHVKTFLKTFPDYEIIYEDIIAKGNKVIVREITRCTHQVEFYGIQPTGNRIESSGIAIFRIENGKIAEVWSESDSLGFMRQLGMELKPKEGEKESYL